MGRFFYLSLCHTDILLGDGYESALSAIFLKPLVIWETNEPQELPAARSARFKVPGSKFNDFRPALNFERRTLNRLKPQIGPAHALVIQQLVARASDNDAAIFEHVRVLRKLQ